jgi:hypothetical protein
MRPSNLTKAPTVTHCMCGPGTRWCARADAIFDVPGKHVTEVQVDDQQRLVLTVESEAIRDESTYWTGTSHRSMSRQSAEGCW